MSAPTSASQTTTAPGPDYSPPEPSRRRSIRARFRAEKHLGSGRRYPEIARINSDVLQGKPGFLLSGTELLLPKAAPPYHQKQPDDSHQVVVHPGDTLSGIAGEELGDPERYPDIFDASQAITQPDGQHLTGPDLIDVGWTLTVPDHKEHIRDSRVRQIQERS
jgi:nucleoid-associated protein YgaU